jgi:hypothetical protein
MINPTEISKSKSRAPGLVRRLVKTDPPNTDGAPAAELVKPKKEVVQVPGAAVVYKDNALLPPEVERLSSEDRPLIWRDLPAFAGRHKRTTSDIVYDLSLLTSHAVALKTPSATVLPFDLELLMRIFDRHPSSCSWQRPDVRTTFEILYGPLIKKLPPDLESAARLALGRRYAKLLGRVDTAQYRWLAADGQITRRLSNILSKIEDVHKSGQDARLFFEYVAKRTWLLRGLDVDLELPLPTVASLTKQPGARGRAMSTKKKKINEPAVYAGGAFA